MFFLYKVAKNSVVTIHLVHSEAFNMIMSNDTINNIVPGRIFYIDFVMQHINSPQIMLLFYVRLVHTRPAN